MGATLGPLTAASFHTTPPLTLPGAPPQPDYLNTAAVGSTAWSPRRILRLAKALEAAAGRDLEAERWSARPLDIDLLVYGDRVCADPDLTLPHPGLAQRDFVLRPLAEVAPHLPVPPDGRTVAELLVALKERGETRGEEPGGGPSPSAEPSP